MLSQIELAGLRRLGNRLRSYKVQIDEMLDFLEKLEQKYSTDAPAGKGKNVNKADRKEKYRRKLR